MDQARKLWHESYELWWAVIDRHERAVKNHWRGMSNDERRRLIRIRRKAADRVRRRQRKLLRDASVLRRDYETNNR